MPEGETRPKGKTSKEWTVYADKKLKQLTDYHGEPMVKIGPVGFGVRHDPHQPDEYSEVLAGEYQVARAKAMKYKRDEAKAALKGYRRGGKVERSGPAILHKGEAVVRAKTRKTDRKASRR